MSLYNSLNVLITSFKIPNGIFYAHVQFLEKNFGSLHGIPGLLYTYTPNLGQCLFNSFQHQYLSPGYEITQVLPGITSFFLYFIMI